MTISKLKVTTSSLPSSRIAVALEIPADQCKTSFDDALKNLCKTANLPGFRKGKVPKAVILQQIGATRIQASALEKLLQKSWEEALDQESIEPLCEPELKDGFEKLLENFDPNKSLKITLETDIAPEPKLKTTHGLKAEVEKIVFNPEKVDKLIEQSRKQLATLVPVENRPAAMGDIAVVSFEGKFSDDNEPIKGGKAESMDLELEKGKMIPGFIEGIVGMSVDDEKSVNCEFPKDYHDETAKGRKANFSIKLNDLKSRELPDLDDSFAKQTSDKNTMKELREELETRLKEECKQNQKKARQESLLKELVKELEVELPKTLIDIEVRNIVEQTARNFAQQGIDVKSIFTPELVDSLMQSSRQEAEDNLRKSLALNALSKAEKIEITENEIDSRFKEIENEFKSQKNFDAVKLKQAIGDDLLQEKLINWLEENNSVIEKTPNKNQSEPDIKNSPKKVKEKSKTSEKKTKKITKEN